MKISLIFPGQGSQLVGMGKDFYDSFDVAKEPMENMEVVMLDFPDEYKKLLRQKYIYRMTMSEIGQINGYSRETARRRFNKAKVYYEEMNESRATL